MPSACTFSGQLVVFRTLSPRPRSRCPRRAATPASSRRGRSSTPFCASSRVEVRELREERHEHRGRRTTEDRIHRLAVRRTFKLTSQLGDGGRWTRRRPRTRGGARRRVARTARTHDARSAAARGAGRVVADATVRRVRRRRSSAPQTVSTPGDVSVGEAVDARSFGQSFRAPRTKSPAASFSAVGFARPAAKPRCPPGSSFVNALSARRGRPSAASPRGGGWRRPRVSRRSRARTCCALGGGRPRAGEGRRARVGRRARSRTGRRAPRALPVSATPSGNRIARDAAELRPRRRARARRASSPFDASARLRDARAARARLASSAMSPRPPSGPRGADVSLALGALAAGGVLGERAGFLVAVARFRARGREATIAAARWRAT